MTEQKKNRGFRAHLLKNPARLKEIASKGGKAAHAKGVAHEWNKKTAAIAGAKGGRISRGGRGRLHPGAI